MGQDNQKLTAAIFVAALLVTARPTWAAQFGSQGTSGSGGEINVTADKLSSGNGAGQVEASGNVEIKREGMILKADEVRINRLSQEVEAKGKVTVDDPAWKIKSADSVRMNMETERGEIVNGDLFLEDGHVSITGRRFEKFGGQTYHIDDGFFTTCLCESGAPSWKFSAEQMDLTLEGTGTIKNGYFYIMDVPVMYIPYGFFPLRSDRQTGFLFPKVGNSNKEGFRYLQPFYWAISKSDDATFTLDVETRARVGLLGEYRTKFSRDDDFSLNTSYFNESLRQKEQKDVVDRTIADQRIPQNRWNVIGSHRFNTVTDWQTFSDIAAYRDDLFTRELIERFDIPGQQVQDIRRSRFGESRFGAFKSWGDTFLKGEWNFYQDFIQPDVTTFQRTPQIGFWGRRFLADFPLEFRWRAEGVNYLRRESGDGLRLDLRPEIVAPFRAGPYLAGSVSVAPRETVYRLNSPAKPSDRNISRELIEIRGNVGSSLSRVFAFDKLGLSQIKHVLEPEVSYLFVPSVDQSDIPIMDGIDRINRRNVFTFALSNRLWGKLTRQLEAPAGDKDIESLSPTVTGDIRQMASLRIALSSDIDKARKGADSLSDIDINLKLTPWPYLDFGLDSGFDPGPWTLNRANATLSITDPRPMYRRTLDPDFNRPNSFSLSYQFLRAGPNGYLAEDANIDLDAPANCAVHPADPRCPVTAFDKNTGGNLPANIFYHVTDNILLNLNGTYDTRDSRFLSVRGSTKFLSFCECWTMTFTVKRDINPAKTSFNFDFNLLGLGNTTKSSLR